MDRAAALRFWVCVVVPLALAGCSDYTPSVAGDHAGAYNTDLAACQESGNKQAHHNVMSSFPYFATYPLALVWQQRKQITACMQGKGYSLD